MGGEGGLLMTTREIHNGMYTEMHFIIGGEIVVMSCCCNAPGETGRECMEASGNKNPCRCYCHKLRRDEVKWKATVTD